MDCKAGEGRGFAYFHAEEVIRSLGMAAEALHSKGTQKMQAAAESFMQLDLPHTCAFCAEAALRSKQGEVSALHSRNHALEEQLRQGDAEREALARRLCSAERSLRQVWAVLWEVPTMPFPGGKALRPSSACCERNSTNS